MSITNLFMDEMAEFFTSRATRMQQVFDAGRTREAWTQAEAFLHFRNSDLCLRVNSHKIAPRCVADFSLHAGLEEAVVLVSELKVYGSRGFLPKNLNGGPVAGWPTALRGPTARHTFRPDDRFVAREGSILKDYRRLVAFSRRNPEIPTVLLLAVIKTGASDRFGSAIERVEFGSKGRILVDRGELLVKAWRVRG